MVTSTPLLPRALVWNLAVTGAASANPRPFRNEAITAPADSRIAFWRGRLIHLPDTRSAAVLTTGVSPPESVPSGPRPTVAVRGRPQRVPELRFRAPPAP